MKDLHIHSVYSDGELNVNQIIEKVKENNVDFFSITDHDTIIGSKEVALNNLHHKNNLKFVTGIELSAKIDKGKCHILGYNYDINNELLNKKIKELKEMSKYNILLVVQYLKKNFNINLKDSDLESIFNKGGTFNNVQIAKLLVDLGYTKTIEESFINYIQQAKMFVKNEKREFSPYECIDIIKKSGGIPVLAHNYQLKKDYMELKAFLIDLKRHGLMGLECYHSGFKICAMLNNVALAKKLNLLITGGSDYHGINVKNDIEIGSGRNENLNIEDISIEKYLSKRLKY